MTEKIQKSTKKKFFEVKVPITAAQLHVYGHSTEELTERIIKIDLTKSLRGKNFELRAKLKAKDKDSLEGEPISLKMIQSYIKRIIRKGTDYIEDSFEVECKNAKIRIKPFMLTRKRVSRAIRKELRNVARKHLESYIKVRTKDEIFSEVTSNKVQKELSLKLKKIYPLALCEIRAIEILSKKKDEQILNQ